MSKKRNIKIKKAAKTASSARKPVAFNVPLKFWYKKAFEVGCCIARRLGLSPQDAKDVVQDSIIRVDRQIRYGRIPVGFNENGLPCNLVRVVYCTFCDHLRKSYMQGPIIDLDLAVERGWILSYPPEAKETLDAMSEANEKTTMEDIAADAEYHSLKERILMIITGDMIEENIKPLLSTYLFDQMSFRKIAQHYGKKPTTTRNWIVKGVEVLCTELADCEYAIA